MFDFLKTAQDQKNVEKILKDYKVCQAELAVLKEEHEKRKIAEERLSFLHEIIREVIDAKDYSDAIGATLRKICEKTEWVYGQVWFINKENDTLRLGNKWYAELSNLENFREESKEHEMETYPGFLRKAWKTKQPVWIQDISSEEDFPRTEVVNKLGIKSALAVPIINAKGEVITIVEFFMLEKKEKDIGLMGMVLAIAAELGGLFDLKENYKIPL